MRFNWLFAAAAIGLLGTSTAWADPDEFGTAQRIDSGFASDLAIDAKRRRLHLVYLNGDSVFYRSGPVDGRFGRPEVIVKRRDTSWYYPRIVLDHNGEPHIVVADVLTSEGMYRGLRNYYSNRIGKRWKAPLVVFDNDKEGAPWANFPTMAIDKDLKVFIGTKLKRPVLSKVARLENVSRRPVVAARADLDLGALNLISKGDELLAVGGEKGKWELTAIEKSTLKRMGEPTPLATKESSEQMRAWLDDRGELHMALAAHNRPETPGFYTNLSRVTKTLPAIRYATTNTHHSGNGRVVRDAVHSDRQYVFYWSGATGGKHGAYGKACIPENRVHFARIDQGNKEKELQPITDRPGGHGTSFRNQPSAVAHPDGGAIVVFAECVAEGASSLWLTTIGGKSGARPKTASSSEP